MMVRYLYLKLGKCNYRCIVPTGDGSWRYFMRHHAVSSGKHTLDDGLMEKCVRSLLGGILGPSYFANEPLVWVMSVWTRNALVLLLPSSNFKLTSTASEPMVISLTERVSPLYFLPSPLAALVCLLYFLGSVGVDCDQKCELSCILAKMNSHGRHRASVKPGPR